jgi:hypothetical protein
LAGIAVSTYVPIPEEKDDPAKLAEAEASFKEFAAALNKIARIKTKKAG